ncbi:hypothetical protein ACWDZ6_16200 [Streptomyces sp. NPDC002926]
MSLTADLPVGDLQFYDNYVPALAPGNWRITVGHTLAGVVTGDLGAIQNMVVSAPQFAIDTNAVLNQYPPAGSTGQYAQVLPHIVLNDALLPWERTLTGSSDNPWLALLVLGEDEIVGGTGSPTRAQAGTVTSFLSADPAVLKPDITQEGDVADTDPCAFIQLSTTLFTALTPRLTELRFLVHCRQSNIADKAEQGLEANGLFSVVVGNRFPAAPAQGGPGAQKSIAHLVSLEGLEPYLVDQPDFGDYTSVALVSLASWTFNTMADQLQDFRGLMENLVGQEYDGTTYTPADLWLRLPAPSPGIDTGTPAGAEADRRLADGFVPLQYQFRTGEQTFAWYRGPCVPVLTMPLSDGTLLPTADAALIYQSAFGVFDASLATAWQTGRALALADRAFGQALYDFRQRGHQLTDSLLQRLQSDAFSADQIAGLSGNTLVQDEFLQFLTSDLPSAPGLAGAARPATGPLPAGAAPDLDPDPVTAVKNFLADAQAQALIADETQDALLPVATWLANLLLLYPVPFNLLVPDGRMLAPETLRFFYLDGNWLRALTDGALSIGMQSSRDSFFTEIMGDVIRQAATTAAQALRARRIGVDPPAAEAAENLVSGFLLRSAVVSGWPNLAVHGSVGGDDLRILRMDRLADDLLFCLFWGVPDCVEFAEPQEGFRFGVDDDGNVPVRQPLAGGSVPLGTQLATPLPLVPGSLRADGDNVLDVATAAQQIQGALSAARVAVDDFGPADFALQMVKSPEAIKFTSPTG